MEKRSFLTVPPTTTYVTKVRFPIRGGNEKRKGKVWKSVATRARASHIAYFLGKADPFFRRNPNAAAGFFSVSSLSSSSPNA
jgi:hypothetical protein